MMNADGLNSAATHLTPTSKSTEQRAIIKHCVKVGMTPTDTLKFLKSDKTAKVTRTIVFDWHKRFTEGDEDVNDRKRSGRPSFSGKINDRIRDILRSDRRRTVQEIAEMTDVSVGKAYNIVTNDLNQRKVCARWVPRLLSDEDKRRRVAASEAFLKRFERQGQRFLDRIITVDETWLFHFDPESKRQSMVWKSPSTPPPKKARVARSMKKHMFIFFMDNQGMLLQHAVPDRQTVNKEYYQKVFRFIFDN